MLVSFLHVLAWILLVGMVLGPLIATIAHVSKRPRRSRALGVFFALLAGSITVNRMLDAVAGPYGGRDVATYNLFVGLHWLAVLIGLLIGFICIGIRPRQLVTTSHS